MPVVVASTFDDALDEQGRACFVLHNRHGFWMPTNVQGWDELVAAYNMHDERVWDSFSHPDVTWSDTAPLDGPVLDLCARERRIPYDSVDSVRELRERVFEGLTRLYPARIPPVVRERVKREMREIERRGLPSFFLLAHSIVDYARENHIPIGYGRGSAGGSAVCYALGITGVDPLKYGLSFERFLDPSRTDLPDIDIDVAPWGRDMIFGWLEETYGDYFARLGERHRDDKGNVVYSVSPCGIVVSDLTGIPRRVDGATVWDAAELAQLGINKVDVLSVTCLDTLAAIPLTVTDTYTPALLAQGDTIGVFQLGSKGMRELLQRIQPSTLEELAIVIALYRPGPLAAKLHELYIRARNSEIDGFAWLGDYGQVSRPILEETCGIPVFQEQIMALAHTIGGLDVSRVGVLRRAMSKKDENLLGQLSSEWSGGQKLWGTLVKFGQFAFNKSHAVAYGRLAWELASWKATDRLAFMVDTITHAKTKDKPGLVASIPDALPADINRSDIHPIIEDGRLRVGLTMRGVGWRDATDIVSERSRGGIYANKADAEKRNPHIPRTVWAALEAGGAFGQPTDTLGQVIASVTTGVPAHTQTGVVSKMRVWERKNGQGVFTTGTWTRGARQQVDFVYWNGDMGLHVGQAITLSGVKDKDGRVKVDSWTVHDTRDAPAWFNKRDFLVLPQESPPVSMPALVPQTHTQQTHSETVTSPVWSWLNTLDDI